MDSDILASTTNITGTTTTKSFKKATDSQVFDDHHIEEVISKAPLAAHSILKVHHSFKQITDIDFVFFLF